jgi:membrane-bound lytic murein transglycosylase B
MTISSRFLFCKTRQLLSFTALSLCLALPGIWSNDVFAAHKKDKERQSQHKEAKKSDSKSDRNDRSRRKKSAQNNDANNDSNNKRDRRNSRNRRDAPLNLRTPERTQNLAPTAPAIGLQPISSSSSMNNGWLGNANVRGFLERMVTQHNMPREALTAMFSRTHYIDQIARLMTPQAQAKAGKKSWTTYRSRFLEPTRINNGLRFWWDYQGILKRAERETGVPPAIIVAILGIETLYGRDTGSFRVIDALTTLAFRYPDTPNKEERTALFIQQLEDYLLWCRDNEQDPMLQTGSYAGAMGMPQFMPSSIRQFGIDFDQDGKIDLQNNPADVIGSVAKFLKVHGWQNGEPVEWKLSDDPRSFETAQKYASGTANPTLRLGDLMDKGFSLADGSDPPQGPNTRVLIIDLPSENQATEYRVGLQNFYVLTRYNRSFFYAQAVYELSEALKQRFPHAGNTPVDR